MVNTTAESNKQAQNDTLSEVRISKENINVGVLYISDPAEGSGYSYTHDLGIQGMQKNLGITDSQIHRVIVDDLDAAATEQAVIYNSNLFHYAPNLA